MNFFIISNSYKNEFHRVFHKISIGNHVHLRPTSPLTSLIPIKNRLDLTYFTFNENVKINQQHTS